MSNNYDAIKDLKENYEDYENSYWENINFINENKGTYLSAEEKNILIAGYLSNMHKTLSTISSNLCQLSYSTYEPSVYIDEIREYQERINNGLIKDDILMYLNSDMVDKEKIDIIREYVSNLKD